MSNMKNSITEAISDFFFEYETPRQVLVRNRRVGVVCRLIQLGVLQKNTSQTGVPIIMKGAVSLNLLISFICLFFLQGAESFVVMTNFIITVGQTQSTCPELPDGKNTCHSDEDCKKGQFKRTGNGEMTGKCVNTTNTCEIMSWCPVEDDRQIPDPPLLLAAENYTLFIKNSITFPEFNVVRSNLVEGVDQNYIKTCMFHPEKDPLCPIFKLGDIAQYSGFNFTQIAQGGGAIGILIDWECNLDLRIQKCIPKYRFHGLYGSSSEGASVGYNFRKAKYYVEDKVEKRTLMKVFGLRIDIIVHGLARKFDIIPTLTAIGSGVGIFGVATVVCDLVLLYLLPKRDFYKNMKFKYTTVQDESTLKSESESQ
uniref:P2X purinoceptor n=1 Tax=Astyanax mexicanus TaxID=7994 RepID=A0A8B9LP91_ASTMX